MKQLIKKVEQWFADRQIIENSTVLKQLLKTSEEVMELQNAILDNDLEEIKDAIGDIQVTLIGVCLHKKMDFHFIYDKVIGIDLDKMDSVVNAFAIEAFINRLKAGIDTFYEEEFKLHIGCCINILLDIVAQYNLTLEECLESAYNVISKRTGKMINGQFVKDK